MSELDKIQAPVDKEMRDFEPFFRSTMKSKVPLLDIITHYVLRRKGKQMRPLLVFLSARLTGSINQKTYIAASLIELLHTASLIHDDVVDDSNMRRGFFSINALWKNKIAVLVGDFFLSKGLLIAIDNEAYDLLKIVSEAVREMSEGELLQIEKARRLDISEEIYFEIIRKKTASLLASCTACGAKSVGSTDEEVEKLRLFGENLGIAFQIKDDLLDYKGTGLLGKPTGNDLKEKKMTLPLINALNNSSSSEKKQIINIVKNYNKNQSKLNEVIAFVEKKGGLKYAESKMIEYKNKAIDIISSYPNNETKESLIKLVDYTIMRNK